MSELCLYIDDDIVNREQGVNELKRRNFNKQVIAPANHEECKTAIETYTFNKALIDYKLTSWVGKDNNNAITIANTECFNGIELAKQIAERSPETEIGLFSSYEQALKSELKKSSISEIVEVVSQIDLPPDDSLRYIPDFFSKTYTFKITSKAIHKDPQEVPGEILTYYSKKLYTCLNEMETVFHAGKFCWLVGVNKDISAKYTEIESLGKEFTSKNKEVNYEIGVNKDNSFPTYIYLSEIDLKINASSSPEEITELNNQLNQHIENKYILDYFITTHICRQYLESRISDSTAMEVLKILGEYSMYESQKLFFKLLLNKFNLGTKEEIYKRLNHFKRNGFPLVLDIFKGRVDAIQDNKALIRLESLSPENIVRKETLALDLLTTYHLELDSQFELTIFKNFFGATSTHIEPI